MNSQKFESMGPDHHRVIDSAIDCARPTFKMSYLVSFRCCDFNTYSSTATFSESSIERSDRSESRSRFERFDENEGASVCVCVYVCIRVYESACRCSITIAGRILLKFT
jgi:hypothetical protein